MLFSKFVHISVEVKIISFTLNVINITYIPLYIYSGIFVLNESHILIYDYNIQMTC